MGCLGQEASYYSPTLVRVWGVDYFSYGYNSMCLVCRLLQFDKEIEDTIAKNKKNDEHQIVKMVVNSKCYSKFGSFKILFTVANQRVLNQCLL